MQHGLCRSSKYMHLLRAGAAAAVLAGCTLLRTCAQRNYFAAAEVCRQHSTLVSPMRAHGRKSAFAKAVSGSGAGQGLGALGPPQVPTQVPRHKMARCLQVFSQSMRWSRFEFAVPGTALGARAPLRASTQSTQVKQACDVSPAQACRCMD
jgi:hypothetical protein